MRLLLLADIHIGSIKEINYVYNVITDIFEKELIFNKCDAVIILGDYFHKLFKVNEEYVSLGINIMSYLVKLCKNSKTKIRLIYGTESHEVDQYRLFNYHINEPGIDFKIIDTISTEELLPGVNVLYVPEEYIESKESHYQKYLYSNNKYDYVFGHGVISEGMSMMEYDKAPKSNEKKVPHFKSGELSSISNICVFGHYHSFVDMGDGCYYLGSLFRDSFGEEAPKGYGIIENGKFIFIENTQAYTYNTYTFDEDSEIFKNTENLMEEIKRIKNDNIDIVSGDKAGKIRIIFKTPADIDPVFKETLRSVLFNDKYISPLIKETSEIVQELKEEIDNEYDFILDNSLAINDKIHRYINKHFETTMSLKELNKYINDKLKI